MCFFFVISLPLQKKKLNLQTNNGIEQIALTVWGQEEASFETFKCTAWNT